MLYAAMFGLVFGALAGCSGCAGSGPSQAEVAKRTFEGEQAACVAVYDTRAEIDACRATVHRLWGQTAPMTPPLSGTLGGPPALEGGAGGANAPRRMPGDASAGDGGGGRPGDGAPGGGGVIREGGF